MKTKHPLKSFVYSLCLLPVAALAGGLSPAFHSGIHESPPASARLLYHSSSSGIHQDVEPVRWPPLGRRPLNPVSIRPLPNGGVQATLRGGCYVICDAYGRVLKENSCSKAELIIATRAARDYLSRRRW